MMNLLDFRTLLSIISSTFGRQEFTARELSNVMTNVLINITKYSPRLSIFLPRFKTKLISNDLRRLYAMGFLKRRRVKRKCKTKNGKICFRGYEYRYSISSQGWKYLEYLVRGKREDEMRDFDDLLVMLIINRSNISDEEKDLLWESYKSSKGKGFRRFSTSEIRLWEKFIEYAWKHIRDERIAKLKKRIEELERERMRLENKIRDLKEENKKLTEVLMEVQSKSQEIMKRIRKF